MGSCSRTTQSPGSLPCYEVALNVGDSSCREQIEGNLLRALKDGACGAVVGRVRDCVMQKQLLPDNSP